jgi:hypothetical protein
MLPMVRLMSRLTRFVEQPEKLPIDPGVLCAAALARRD